MIAKGLQFSAATDLGETPMGSPSTRAPNRGDQYLAIIIMKFISDKMFIETIKKKEKNPHTNQYL